MRQKSRCSRYAAMRMQREAGLFKQSMDGKGLLGIFERNAQ